MAEVPAACRRVGRRARLACPIPQKTLNPLVRLLTLVLVLLGLAVPLPGTAAVGRWALVIGNDAYQSVEPLKNAAADARLIGSELQRAGFSVTTVLNATRRTMLRAIVDISRRAEGGGEVVFYFAGHGVQVANTNHLLPVDFDGSDPALLSHEALSLTEVISYLQESKPRFALMIVDACRNNPLMVASGRSLSATRGLSPMQPATGQMIVFSAGSGQVALDEVGNQPNARNGLFARELARHMRLPGMDIREVMLSVRASVEKVAASVQHAQRPAIYDESNGRFAFHVAQAGGGAGTAERPYLPEAPSPTASPSPGFRSAEDIEDELWKSISGSQWPESFAAYLREYPTGRYAAAARVRIEVLRRSGTSGSSSATAPATPIISTPSRSETPGQPSGTEVPRNTAGADRAGASDRQALVGKRYAGDNGEYRIAVRVDADDLEVESFSRVQRVGADVGQRSAIQCGLFRSRISMNERFEVRGNCTFHGTFPVAIVVSGIFPRVVIGPAGRPWSEALDLREVSQQ